MPVNVGSVLRARATFRDAGRLFDPRIVVADAVWAGGSRRMSTSSGEVIRESIGIFSALIPVADAPTITITFSDGRELTVSQVFQVVSANVKVALSPLDIAAESARADARRAIAAEDAAPRPTPEPDPDTIARVRAKARADAQADIDAVARAADARTADEKRRADNREALRNQWRPKP